MMMIIIIKRNVIHRELCKKFKYEEMVYAQPNICPGILRYQKVA